MFTQGSGRYPHLKEPGKAAKPGTSEVQSTASNHAYPPTAGSSSAAKPSQPSKAGTSKTAALEHSSSDAAAYTPIGKDAKLNKAGSGADKASAPTPKSAGNHAYPPTTGTSAATNHKPDPGSSRPTPSSSASATKPQTGSSGSNPPQTPINHAYEPIGASAPVNSGSASSSKPNAPTAGQPAR